MNIYYTSIKGRRKTNEDRHNIILNIHDANKKINDINLLGIYDGHGGTFVSEYLASNIPLYYCHRELKTPFSREYHKEVFDNLQESILKTKKGQSTGSTCLLNIMYKFKDKLHFNTVNLGDGRLVIVYNNGTAKQVTTDHKPDHPIEKDRINKLGGEIYNDSEGVVRVGDLSLSRAFGDGDNAPYISHTPDIYYNTIVTETKYIVMGCDGLWDVIPNNDLFSLLEQYSKKDKKNLAADLAKEALERRTTDNVSVIVIEISDFEKMCEYINSETTDDE